MASSKKGAHKSASNGAAPDDVADNTTTGHQNIGGSNTSNAQVPLAALRRLARKPAPPAIVEHCELCGVALPPEHRHLVNRKNQTLACACTACSLLFESGGAVNGLYSTIPQRYLALQDFQMSDEQWDDLMIPVNIAFIYVSTAADRAVAYYPGPAGATESLLTLERWETLMASNAVLHEMKPDVEALLINRLKERRDYYIVPIDTCYELVGILRSSWRGLGGGQDVWNAINEFFDTLHAKASM